MSSKLNALFTWAQNHVEEPLDELHLSRGEMHLDVPQHLQLQVAAFRKRNFNAQQKAIRSWHKSQGRENVVQNWETWEQE